MINISWWFPAQRISSLPGPGPRLRNIDNGACGRSFDFIVACLPGASVAGITEKLIVLGRSQQSWGTSAPVRLGKVVGWSWRKKLSYLVALGYSKVALTFLCTETARWAQIKISVCG